VSASVSPPLHHKVQNFSSGTGSPVWSRKKGRKTVVVWWCFGEKPNAQPDQCKPDAALFHHDPTPVNTPWFSGQFSGEPGFFV